MEDIQEIVKIHHMINMIIRKYSIFFWCFKEYLVKFIPFRN